MAYTIIPNATDKPSTSQQQIKDNFSDIQTVIGVDHVTFTGASADQGKHNQITFANLGAAQPATTGSQRLLYNNGGELFLQNSSDDNFNVTQANNSQANGFMFTWSGHVIRWGKMTATGNATPNFPTAFGATPTHVQITVAAESAPNRVFWDQDGAKTTATTLGVKVTKADGTTSATATFFFWAFGAR